MLKFLGRGSAFNVKEGNTSAYTAEKGSILLFDCGESVFNAMRQQNVLQGIPDVNVLITHTHPDHAGSLGTLAMYTRFEKKSRLNILLDENALHLKNIEGLLEASGVKPDWVNFKNVDTLGFDNVGNLRFVPTSHCDEIKSHGIAFDTPCGSSYYSGDTREITQIYDIITGGNTIDKVYVDVTTLDYSKNVHLSLRELDQAIPQGLREKFYCMHVNNDDCIARAKQLGFNVVEVEK